MREFIEIFKKMNGIQVIASLLSLFKEDQMILNNEADGLLLYKGLHYEFRAAF